MTTISASTLSLSDSVAQQISGASPPSSPNSLSANKPAAANGFGPATDINLSDRAKATIARARSDQAAADRLRAFVEANRNRDANPNSNAQQNASSGGKSEAIVERIATIASANEPQPFQAFTPTQSLSNSISVGGFTLSLSTNAGTQYFGFKLSGNGVTASNDHFGSGANVGSLTQVPPGVTVSFSTPGNNQAEEEVTITQSSASLNAVSASSSSAGAVAASSVNGQSSSITFRINYQTGQISVAQAAASVTARSASFTPPGSTISALA